MTIEIVDLPIENGDFPSFFVCLPEGKSAISVVELQGIKQLFSIVKWTLNVASSGKVL